MNWELVQNITLSFVSILAFLGLIIFYWKIWRISVQIKICNRKIEEQKDILNKQEIESIKSDNEWGVFEDNKEVKQEKRSIEQKIEKLERKKKYLLEEISMYKLFKK